MTLMQGDGLVGGSIPLPSPPIDNQRSYGRRSSDQEVVNQLHTLETQMAVVETRMEALKESLEEVKEEFTADIRRVEDTVKDIVDKISEIVDRKLAEHTVEERVSTEAKFARMSEDFKEMQTKADKRHEVLKDIAKQQEQATELLSTLKSGALRMAGTIIIGGGVFTISTLTYIFTHIDTINRIVDNLTK